MKQLLIIVGCAVATFFGCATVFADPQLSASVSLTPQNVVGGDIVSFQFSVTNSNDAESSNLTNSLLQVSLPLATINGVQRYLDLIIATAPGGAISYVFDGDGISGANVNYALIGKGTSRTFSVSLQVPNSGLVNNSTINVAGTLTWAQPPGTLTRSTNAIIHASPSLQTSLDPVPLFTAPAGRITYRAQCNNVGSGITRKAWLVAPIPPNISSSGITILTTNSAIWYSSFPYTIAQANSDDYIRSHFTLATVNQQGTHLIPNGTRMLAVSLDDPELHLLQSGVPKDFAWQVYDANSAVGTVIDQGLWIFSEDWPATPGISRQTTIRLLPADFRIVKQQNQAILTFVGEPIITYQIERSADFAKWFNLGAASETNQGSFQFMDTNLLPFAAFYRITTNAP